MSPAGFCSCVGVGANRMLLFSDYPSFYTRLYDFLDRDVLHLKHRARFFRMTELFLSSTCVVYWFPMEVGHPERFFFCFILDTSRQLSSLRSSNDSLDFR